MVDNNENYKLDLGVQGWNEEIYDIFFTFSQKVSLTKKKKTKKQPDLTWLMKQAQLSSHFSFWLLCSSPINQSEMTLKKSNTGTQSSQSSQRILHSQISLVWKNHTGEECISLALIHSLRSDQQVLFTAKQAKRQNQLLTLFHYNIDRNKLIFLVFEKIYSPQCWWIVVNINWATEWQVNIHHWSPPLRWNIF